MQHAMLCAAPDVGLKQHGMNGPPAAKLEPARTAPSAISTVVRPRSRRPNLFITDPPVVCRGKCGWRHDTRSLNSIRLFADPRILACQISSVIGVFSAALQHSLARRSSRGHRWSLSARSEGQDLDLRLGSCLRHGRFSSFISGLSAEMRQTVRRQAAGGHSGLAPGVSARSRTTPTWSGGRSGS